MVLVGPSGCGKSTTLRMVAGLETPTAGHIYIGDEEVTEVPPQERDIAMVFQSYALYPHMTAFQNMAFGLEVRGISKKEIRERVEAAAEILGIRELLGRRPGQLSGGQRQRTALGRSIVRQPRAFLFDEPLSNLDASLRVGMRAELSQLHRRLEATIIYVTHDQVEAMTMGQRIAVMNDGRLQQCAAPLEVYCRPANLFVAGFIGSPAMNFFSGDLRSVGEAWEFRGASFKIGLPPSGDFASGPATLGIRPEDLRLSAGGALGATVRVVEPIGSELYVHLTTTAGATAIARAPADARVAVDERVGLELPASKLHIFGGTSGTRIGP